MTSPNEPIPQNGAAGASGGSCASIITNPPEATKRGRGRPKGSGAAAATAGAAVPSPAAPVPSIWDLEKSKVLVRAVPAAAAVWLDEEKIALTDNEADQLAQPFLEVLKQFMPAAGAKYAAVIALAAGVAAVGIGKAPIIRAALVRKAEKRAAEAEKKEKEKAA